jgi:hypothetical protein
LNRRVSGEASPTISSCYANFKSSLFISLEIDCFHGLWTRKYLHSMTKLSGWLRHCAESTLYEKKLFWSQFITISAGYNIICNSLKRCSMWYPSFDILALGFMLSERSNFVISIASLFQLLVDTCVSHQKHLSTTYTNKKYAILLLMYFFSNFSYLNCNFCTIVLINDLPKIFEITNAWTSKKWRKTLMKNEEIHENFCLWHTPALRLSVSIEMYILLMESPYTNRLITLPTFFSKARL